MQFNEEVPKCTVRTKNKVVTRTLILEIEFTHFPIFYQLSKKRRAKYVDKREIENVNGVRKVVSKKVLTNPRTVGKGRYTKITNQKIDNGEWGNEVKQKVVDFVKGFIRDQLSVYDIPQIKTYLAKHKNIIIESHFHLPENYGTVKMINDSVNEGKTYMAWDVDNLGTFWNKRFVDVITAGTAKAKKGQRKPQGSGLNIIKDDDIKTVKGAGGSIWYPVKKLSDRKIIFSFYVESNV